MPPGRDLYEVEFVQSRQSGPIRLRIDMTFPEKSWLGAVEMTGFEPATLYLQGRRSPN